MWVVTAWLASVISLNELGLNHRALAEPWSVVALTCTAAALLLGMAVWPVRCLAGESGSFTDAVAWVVGQRVAWFVCVTLLTIWVILTMRFAGAFAGIFLYWPFREMPALAEARAVGFAFLVFCCATAPRRDAGMFASARLFGMFGSMLAVGAFVRYAGAARAEMEPSSALMREVLVDPIQLLAPMLLLTGARWSRSRAGWTLVPMTMLPLLALAVVSGAVALGTAHQKFPNYAAIFTGGSSEWRQAKSLVAAMTLIFPVRWAFFSFCAEFPRVPRWLCVLALSAAACFLPDEWSWYGREQVYGQAVLGMALVLFAAAVVKKIRYFVKTPNISPP